MGALSRKTRILSVVYNASSNELVRTNTLVKGAIVTVDAGPFKQWYAKYYGIDLSKSVDQKNIDGIKRSSHAKRKINSRNLNHKLDPHLAVQFDSGKLYACLSSRPGQCGRADGYILEGRELEFYLKKIAKKRVPKIPEQFETSKN